MLKSCKIIYIYMYVHAHVRTLYTYIVHCTSINYGYNILHNSAKTHPMQWCVCMWINTGYLATRNSQWDSFWSKQSGVMAQRQRADISGHTYISITHSIPQDQSILIFINYCSMSLCILLHSLGEGGGTCRAWFVAL